VITVRDIQLTVARNFRCDPDEFISSCRARDVAHPRQIAMLLSRELTKHSLPRIGALFERDHTTVLHGISAAKRRIEADAELALKVDQIRRVLKANYLQKDAIAHCLNTAFEEPRRPRPVKLMMEFGMEPEFAKAARRREATA
jgi:hypothetical protein